MWSVLPIGDFASHGIKNNEAETNSSGGEKCWHEPRAYIPKAADPSATIPRELNSLPTRMRTSELRLMTQTASPMGQHDRCLAANGKHRFAVREVSSYLRWASLDRTTRLLNVASLIHPIDSCIWVLIGHTNSPKPTTMAPKCQLQLSSLVQFAPTRRVTKLFGATRHQSIHPSVARHRPPTGYEATLAPNPTAILHLSLIRLLPAFDGPA